MRDENIAIKERLMLTRKKVVFHKQNLQPGIGVSMTALSQYRSGKYKGDIKAVESKIEEFLKTVEEQKNRKKKFNLIKLLKIIFRFQSVRTYIA